VKASSRFRPEEYSVGRALELPANVAIEICHLFSAGGTFAGFCIKHSGRGQGGVDLIFRDLPSVPPGPMGRFLLTQMAAVAELEARLLTRLDRAN
jgi:hypothetical protein